MFTVRIIEPSNGAIWYIDQTFTTLEEAVTWAEAWRRWWHVPSPLEPRVWRQV